MSKLILKKITIARMNEVDISSIHGGKDVKTKTYQSDVGYPGCGPSECTCICHILSRFSCPEKTCPISVLPPPGN